MKFTSPGLFGTRTYDTGGAPLWTVRYAPSEHGGGSVIGVMAEKIAVLERQVATLSARVDELSSPQPTGETK